MIEQPFSEAHCATETPDVAGDLADGFRDAGYHVNLDSDPRGRRSDGYVMVHAIRVREHAATVVGVGATGTMLLDSLVWNRWLNLDANAISAPAELLDRVVHLIPNRPVKASRRWVRVFDSHTMSERAPKVELFVRDDLDATIQLAALAEAIGTGADELTIRWPRGCHGYGY